MKATSLVSWKVPTTSHGFHRVRGVPLVWLASAAIVLASCNVQWEAPSYGYDVWNYSTNHYLVRLTFQDGTARVAAVPPDGIVWRDTKADPQQADHGQHYDDENRASLPVSGGN